MPDSVSDRASRAVTRIQHMLDRLNSYCLDSKAKMLELRQEPMTRARVRWRPSVNGRSQYLVLVYPPGKRGEKPRKEYIGNDPYYVGKALDAVNRAAAYDTYGANIDKISIAIGKVSKALELESSFLADIYNSAVDGR